MTRVLMCTTSMPSVAVSGPGSRARPSSSDRSTFDELLGGDIEQLAVRGCRLKRQLRQQNPPVRVEAVVDDAFIELIGLLGATIIHP